MKPVLALRHSNREPLDTVGTTLRRQGLAFEYVHLQNAPSRQFDPAEVSGLVILGGAMNVDETDRHPYLSTEIDWIQLALAADVPLLGICLGAQLLAAALGARVWHSPIKEIGWYDIETIPPAASDPLLRHLGPRASVFQWHGDTFDLPTGAVRLASSAVCENQAYRYGDTAWAIQFHLEVTDAIIHAWMTEPDGCAELAELDYIDPAQIIADTPHKLPVMQSLAAQIFAEFGTFCQARAGKC